MNDDTISRQAAIDKIETAAEFWSNADEYAEGCHAGYLLAANLLKALPSAERRGRWISQEYMSEIDSFIYTEYKCSNCGEISKKKSNYCPNCGARMEETP